MDRATAVRAELEEEWIPAIYKKIRTGRTRSYKLDVPVRENTAEIQYTLLGIELKVGKRRFACPDLATARYLRVFARLGCTDIAVPYDITQISTVADELETSWQKMILIVHLMAETLSQSAGRRLRSDVLRSIRDEIGEIGAGSAMPEFDRQTRQRGV